MLLLSRREGESVMIGDDIQVTVDTISNRVVRLRFTAPTRIPIWRQEVYDLIVRDGNRKLGDRDDKV